MAKKKAFQAPPPAVQVRPRPRPLPPPPYPELAPEPAEIHYPSSDGKPMADNTWQSHTMFVQYSMLSARYMDDPDTFVAMALLLYYTEGEPADVVAPDLFVSCGVPNRLRDWYKVWEEGKVPDFALEVSSEESAEDNLGRHLETYARIGIREYCVYDPMGGLHSPRLQLFRLAGGEAGVYERVPWSGDTDDSLAVPSESLGLELRFEDDRLRLWDPAAQEYLLDFIEEHERLLEEQDRWLKQRDALLKLRDRWLKERDARLKLRARRLEERDRRLKERDRRIEERAKRIAAEQRLAKLEIELEALKAQFRGKP